MKRCGCERGPVARHARADGRRLPPMIPAALSLLLLSAWAVALRRAALRRISNADRMAHALASLRRARRG